MDNMEAEDQSGAKPKSVVWRFFVIDEVKLEALCTLCQKSYKVPREKRQRGTGTLMYHLKTVHSKMPEVEAALEASEAQPKESENLAKEENYGSDFYFGSFCFYNIFYLNTYTVLDVV
jgi:hypothetical protein